MSSFLDRQSIYHPEIEKKINSIVYYSPDKNEFANAVSKKLGTKVAYHPSMDEWFLKIKHVEKKSITAEIEMHAEEYVRNLMVRKHSIERFQKRDCPKRSIDLPERPVKSELGGRIY